MSKKNTSKSNDSINQHSTVQEQGLEKKHFPELSLPLNGNPEDELLAKEVKSFNRLMKEIDSYEQKYQEEQQLEDEYHRVRQAKLMPLFREKGEILLRFVILIDEMSYSTKLTKNQERQMVMLVLSFIEEIEQSGLASDETKTLRIKYINLNIELMNKTDKKNLADELASRGQHIDFDNFSIEDIWERENERQAQENEKEEEPSWEDEPPIKKKTSKAAQDIAFDLKQLYKELAKIIHPDTEQDPKLKLEKEALMQSLTEAKRNNDLFSLLLINNKVYQTYKRQALKVADLAQLKRYNKGLKLKLQTAKEKYEEALFGKLVIDEYGFMKNLNFQNPEKQIKKEAKSLKEGIQAMKQDLQFLSQTYDLKGWLQSIHG